MSVCHDSLVESVNNYFDVYPTTTETLIRDRVVERKSTQEDADWLLRKVDALRAELAALRAANVARHYEQGRGYGPVPMPVWPAPAPIYPPQIYCDTTTNLRSGD